MVVSYTNTSRLKYSFLQQYSTNCFDSVGDVILIAIQFKIPTQLLSQAACAWGFFRPGIAKLKATTNSFSVHTSFIENDTFECT